MPTQALIIDEPWIGHIMAGRKTWEMRSRRTTKRGPIALVRKGSGQIVAIGRIVDCLPPLTAGAMANAFDRHRIPQAMVEQDGYKWFTPWVLEDVRVLEQPVTYRHPPGAVTWVDLAPEVQTALAATGLRPPISHSIALSERRIEQVQPPYDIARPASPSARSTARTDNAEANEAMAARVLDELRIGPSKLDIPHDANVSITQRGNKLHIDAVWDDGKPAISRGTTGWREFIGIFSVLGALLCMVTFIIMMMVGVATWSMTFFHAFYAVPPMAAFSLIATMTGHAHLLPDFNEGHDRRDNPR